MKKKNGMPDDFGELLAGQKMEQTQRARFLTGVEYLQEYARYAAICGSWMASEGTLSLLVRRTGDNYALLLCDNTHCYKTIVRELTAVLQGRRLIIVPDGEEVILGADGMLHCGSFGMFRREESLLHEELEYEMEFALRGSEHADEQA